MRAQEINIQQEIVNRINSRQTFTFPRGAKTEGMNSIDLFVGKNPSQEWDDMHETIYRDVADIVMELTNDIIVATKDSNGTYTVKLYY